MDRTLPSEPALTFLVLFQRSDGRPAPRPHAVVEEPDRQKGVSGLPASWNANQLVPGGTALILNQCGEAEPLPSFDSTSSTASVNGCTDAFINATIRPPAGIGRPVTGLLRRPATQQENFSACDRPISVLFFFLKLLFFFLKVVVHWLI